MTASVQHPEGQSRTGAATCLNSDCRPACAERLCILFSRLPGQHHLIPDAGKKCPTSARLISADAALRNMGEVCPRFSPSLNLSFHPLDIPAHES